MTFEMTFFPGLSQWLKIAQTVSFSVKQNYLNSLTFFVGFSNTVNYISQMNLLKSQSIGYSLFSSSSELKTRNEAQRCIYAT